MRIQYRMAEEKDIDSMAEFWSENSEWDIIDRGEWEKRFVHTPFGKAEVALGLDQETGKIICQFIFIPVDIMVNGQQLKGYRPFAPLLEKTLQTKFGVASLLTGQHPLLKMYKKMQDHLCKQGVTLIYMIPDPRWSRVLQAFPFVLTHKFPLYTRGITANEKSFRNENVLISTSSAAEIEFLWKQSSNTRSCSIIRDHASLSWKASHGNFKTYTVTCNNQPIGLFVFIYKQKDHQWLICDIVTIDEEESLNMILQAACATIEKEAPGEPGKIAILATVAIEPVVKKLGFEKNDYHFTLAVHPLNSNGMDKKTIAPANWYISAND